IPTVRAGEDELLGVLTALGECGTGVFQLLSDFFSFEDVEGEFAMFRRLVAETGRPLSFTLNQKHNQPDMWRRLLELTEQAAVSGLPIRAQVLGRPTGLLLGHELTLSPFATSPTYAALAGLPLPERVAELCQPERRERILAELGPESSPAWAMRFELLDPPNYEPELSESFAA